MFTGIPEFKKEIHKIKKYLILLLVIVSSISMLFIGISCKEEVPPPEKVIEEEVSPIEEEKLHEGATMLTDNSADDAFPSWSPDGKMIAFSSNRSVDIAITADENIGATTQKREGSYEIYVLNAEDKD